MCVFVYARLTSYMLLCRSFHRHAEMDSKTGAAPVYIGQRRQLASHGTGMFRNFITGLRLVDLPVSVAVSLLWVRFVVVVALY